MFSNGWRRAARAASRWSKGLVREQLGRLGLTLKGFEVRGGRLAQALNAEIPATPIVGAVTT